MKFIGLAICSLGIWVVLNSFLSDAVWDDIVFGVLTVVLALIGSFRIKE